MKKSDSKENNSIHFINSANPLQKRASKIHS